MSRDTSNALAVLSSHFTKRKPRFTGIQVVFKISKPSGLFTRWTVKDLMGTIVNRGNAFFACRVTRTELWNWNIIGINTLGMNNISFGWGWEDETALKET